MEDNEKFCLRWNEFESNISVAFKQIREEKDLFDVTLSCGSKQIQAHKLILSASSTFFKTVLRQNVHPHPLLYLKGVQFKDIKAVLDFMYHGEVSVAQEDLNSFLTIAEDLQVKGLTQESSSVKNQSKILESESVNSQAPAASKRQSIAGLREQNLRASGHDEDKPLNPCRSITRDNYHRESYPSAVKAEPEQAVTLLPYEVNTVSEVGADDSHEIDGYEDLDYAEQQHYETDESYLNQNYDGTIGLDSQGSIDVSTYIVIGYSEAGMKTFSCQLCGKSFKNNAHVKTHIENVHAGEKVQCGVCNRILKNKQSLITHCSTQHGLTKYQIPSIN